MRLARFISATEGPRNSSSTAAHGAGGGHPPILCPLVQRRDVLGRTPGEDSSGCLGSEVCRHRHQCGPRRWRVSYRNFVEAGGADSGEAEDVPRAVPEGRHAVRALSGHDPPRGRSVCRGLGRGRVWEKMALGLWQDSSENHEICEAWFRGLEHRGLALARRILFVTDGGSGLIKALRAWFGKKLVHQRCAIHKSRNLQRHLAKPYRPEAHRRLMTALEQTNYADARRMLRELEAWLRTKNESAAESLVEAFEELLALHQGQVPPLLRKTLLSTNPIESMFSLVRHSERNIKRTRGSRMLQRWLGTVLLACEGGSEE